MKRFCSVVMIACVGATSWSANAHADEDASTVPGHVPTARVRVSANDVIVRLDRRDGPDDPWRRACDSPCGVVLPLTGEYRINGGEPFPLHGSDGAEIELAYRGPSSTGAGSILIGVGAVALPLGVLMIAERSERRVGRRRGLEEHRHHHRRRGRAESRRGDRIGRSFGTGGHAGRRRASRADVDCAARIGPAPIGDDGAAVFVLIEAVDSEEDLS